MPDDIEPLLDTNENFQPEQDNDGDDYLLNAVDDDSDVSNTPCCNPSHLCHRLIGLILMCLLGFGSYFCYDSPGALQEYIKNDMNITTTQFANLYAWYSWPNVFLCFVGGFLLDRVFGKQWGTTIFATFVLIGQIVFALGGIFNTFWIMEAGRFIFGIGGESLAVAQNTYAVGWFKGKELNMVFGLQLSFARVGSTVNFNVMGPLYRYVNQFYQGSLCTGVTLMIAAVFCLMSLLSSIILGLLDKRRDRILKKQSTSQPKEEEKIRLSDVKDFPTTYWMMSLVCMFYYAVIFPFIGLGQTFFTEQYGMATDKANTINSLVYLISTVASPFFGLMVDRLGRNVLWVVLSVMGTAGAHAILGFAYGQENQAFAYAAMVLMGVSYSMLASALWPMVALVVPEYQLGTAYGLMQAIQNLGMALLTMVCGLIVDKEGYQAMEIFFLGMLVVTLILCLIIWILDYQKGGHLNMSTKQREEYEDALLGKSDTDMINDITESEITPYDLLQPRTHSDIRNRYLARLGALPVNQPTQSGLQHRALR
ncbi:major facilitator superfamily domain-containing protein 1-like [Artemia franciscana]|uniref:major facilitator superfamily domain-containing protein 1-like n=1 Tax=Artemia franciscana TaxID=6661 RepID=UPI0032DA3322